MKKHNLLFFYPPAQLRSNQFLAPYEMTIESELAFAPAQEEIDQMRLSFEAQQWPVEVLKYTLFAYKIPISSQAFRLN